MLRFLAALLFLAAPMWAAAPAVPTGVTSTGYVDGTIPLSWAYDVAPTQWYVYSNGTLYSAPTRAQVQLQGVTTVTYTLTGVPATAIPATIYLKAVSSGGVSAGSVPILVTGTASSGGTAVTVTNPASAPVNIAGPVYVTNVVDVNCLSGCGGSSAAVINVFKPIVGVAVAPAATLWTPASGKKFRLMGYSIAGDTAGVYTLFDGAVTITVEYLSNAGPGKYVAMGNGWLSAAANTPLTCLGPGGSSLAGLLMGAEE